MPHQKAKKAKEAKEAQTLEDLELMIGIFKVLLLRHQRAALAAS
jgi:hypothetical protein